MKKVLWSVLSISLYLSCTNQNDPAVSIDEDGCIVLNLDEARKRPSDLKWSDMATSIEYIPLETSDSCLLLYPGILDMTNDHILISNGNDVPYLFDRQGNFLNRIGIKGRGPGEIQQHVRHGYIDPKTNDVSLFFNDLSVMRFNIHGKFLEEDRLSVQRFHTGETHYRSPHLPMYNHIGNGDKTFYFHFNADSTRIFTSSTYDRETTFERVPGMYGVYYTSEPHERFLDYNNIHYDTQYAPCFYKTTDYIGYFDGQKNHGRYYRFYYDGRIENPYRIVYENAELDGGLNISTFDDLKDYVYILGYFNEQWESFLYEVQSRRLHYLSGGIPNDMDKNVPLVLSKSTPDGQKLYGLLNPVLLRKQVASFPNARLHALLDSLPEDANGILIYATLK